MKETEHSILKIYASSTDRIGQKLLYEHIVLLARERGLSGVTVYRGIMGYGLSSRISAPRFWELTEKLPVVIELVDTEEKIKAFYELIAPELESGPKGCLVTLAPVAVILHKPGKKPA